MNLTACRPWTRIASLQVADDPVGVPADGCLVDRGHRVEAARIPAHAVRQVRDIEAQGTIDVEQRGIHPGVVHLRDAAAWPERDVVQVGWVDLLGVVVAVNGPGQPMVRPINPEGHVCCRPQGLCVGRVEQSPRIRMRSIPCPPGRLMMQGVEDLDLLQVRFGARVSGRLVR